MPHNQVKDQSYDASSPYLGRHSQSSPLSHPLPDDMAGLLKVKESKPRPDFSSINLESEQVLHPPPPPPSPVGWKPRPGRD